MTTQKGKKGKKGTDLFSISHKYICLLAPAFSGAKIPAVIWLGVSFRLNLIS